MNNGETKQPPTLLNLGIDQTSIIVLMEFGSHLYGTATEKSDLDFKGVFIPTFEQILLGQIPHNIRRNNKVSEGIKNTTGDVDVELFSLHEFVKLACEGQTLALDMLHAPKKNILVCSQVWNDIIAHRNKFCTRKLNAFVGYCRTQAAKYGVKGSRLNTVQKIVDILSKANEWQRLSDLAEQFTGLGHVEVSKNEKGLTEYQICGKKLQETTKVDYALGVLGIFLRNYGERARQAQANEGIDWKAVSHAVRVAFEMKQLLTEHTITFPLKEVAFVKAVKAGELDYMTVVAPKLEELMDEVEKLSAESNLPEKVDRKFWEAFVVKIVKEIYCNGNYIGS